MTASRNLSLPAHGAIEFSAGLAMLLAPVIFGFGPAGFIVSFALGALLIGVALPLTEPRSAIVAWHRDFDTVFLLGAAVSALALALAGERSAGVFLAALVALQSALYVATRYSSGN